MEKMDGRCAEASFFQNSSKRNSAFGTELEKNRESRKCSADMGLNRMMRMAVLIYAERGGGSGGQVLLRRKFVV